MKLQRLLSLVRKAVDDYSLIDENDKIAVGISGGKDSLTLLYALHELQRFYPKHFELCALTVDLGFGIQDFDAIKTFCRDFSVRSAPVFSDHGDPDRIYDLEAVSQNENKSAAGGCRCLHSGWRTGTS